MLWHDALTLPAKQLTSELFTRGLAPQTVEVLECYDGPFYYYGPPSGVRWRPTTSWDDVAHLIERFQLAIRPGQHGGYVVGHNLITEKVSSLKHVPALICRLAIYLHDARGSDE